MGSGRRTPDDFRFFCFDGVPQAIYVVQDRFTRPTINWYDATWVPLPYELGWPPGDVQPAPAALAEMVGIARRLSEGFDFLRVDLYCVDGRVYCGELTLYPGCGLEPFTPPEADTWLGGFWKLPGRESGL